jgi:hypothetical protein
LFSKGCEAGCDSDGWVWEWMSLRIICGFPNAVCHRLTTIESGTSFNSGATFTFPPFQEWIDSILEQLGHLDPEKISNAAEISDANAAFTIEDFAQPRWPMSTP